MVYYNHKRKKEDAMSKVYLFIDGSGTDLFVSATYNGAIDTAIRRGYINCDTSAYACEESDSDDSYGIQIHRIK